jgi:hypothetical protein
MVMSWTEPAHVLIDRVPRDLGGLWSLLYAAELGAVHQTSAVGVDGDVVGVVIDLREAVEELEWQHPDVDRGQAAIDLKPPETGGAGNECEAVLASLLGAAVGMCADLIRDPTMSVADVLMLARVVTLVTSGHLRLTGHLP